MCLEIHKQEPYTSVSILHKVLNFNQKDQIMDEDLNIGTSVFRSLEVLKGIPSLQELHYFYFFFYI